MQQQHQQHAGQYLFSKSKSCRNLRCTKWHFYGPMKRCLQSSSFLKNLCRRGWICKLCIPLLYDFSIMCPDVKISLRALLIFKVLHLREYKGEIIFETRPRRFVSVVSSACYFSLCIKFKCLKQQLCNRFTC